MRFYDSIIHQTAGSKTWYARIYDTRTYPWKRVGRDEKGFPTKAAAETWVEQEIARLEALDAKTGK